MKNNYFELSLLSLRKWYALMILLMVIAVLRVDGQTVPPPITVCASGCDYTTIQAAINAASAGDVIEVAAGTYSENILVNKSLTLKGAQFGVKATGSARSGGESVIDGTGGSSSYVITVEADNVTIDGFKVEIRSSARDGINTRTGNAVSPATTALRTNIALRNNWIYANLPSRTNQFNGIVFGEHISNAAQSFSAEISNVTIEDNYIDLTSTSSNATPSNQSITGARGIIFTNMFRNSGASLSYTNLVVDDNIIYSTYVTMMQAQLQTRLVGATITNNTIGNSRSGPNLPTLISGSVFSNNTIQNINPGSDYYSNLAGAYLGVVNSTVSNNTFQNIGGTACLVIAGGRSADATYFPASSNSLVSNNFITYNDQALSSLAGYTAGILFEPNTVSAAVNVNGWLTGRQAGTTGADASSITVSNNSIVNGGFAAITAYAVSQESAGETSSATCNWFGASTNPSGKMSGSVTFSPWLISGTDSDGSTSGLQPAAGTCTGTPVVASVSATDGNCATPTSVNLTVSGGSAPYVYAWSNSATTEDLSGVVTGTYTVTVTDANGSTASASGSVIYSPVHNTTANTYHATIQAAINAASAGDVINVCAGTYTENLSVNKRLTIDGAGSGSNASSNTIITAAASGTSTIVYSTGGTDASNRQILKDVRVIGATGGTGNNNSGILISGGSMGYFTFDNITATGNTGHGLVSNVAPATSSLTDVIITGSSFASNGSAGIRTASHSVDGFSVSNSSFTSNTGLGLAFNSSENNTVNIGGISLTNVSFSGNNSVADLFAHRMVGTMSLTNVDFLGSAGSGFYGLYLNGQLISSAPAIAAVTLNDVTVSGAYTTGGIAFRGYSNLANVSMTDVVLNTSIATADRGHLALIGVGGTLNIGNTAFIQPTTNPPTRYIRLGSITTTPIIPATLTVTATSATFDGKIGSAMTTAELFDTEDKIRHGTDDAVNVPGFVRVKANNVYVTTSSGSVQRGIDVATSGDVLNINDGTYTAQAITVNKQLDIRGQGNGTIVQNSGGNAFTYTAAGSGSSASNRAYLRNVKLSGSDKGIYTQDLVNYLTLDGVTIDGNTSYGIHMNNTSGIMQDWAITNCTFNANADGFRMGMAANIDGLSITGTTFSNQVSSGIYIPQQSTAPGGCSNVTITGNTFANNANASSNNAAMYIEKLSNATISNNTITNNGPTTNPRGILLNLKYGNYSNVTISGNILNETRVCSGTSGMGILAAGLNTLGYAANPASLSNISILGNEVNGAFYDGLVIAANVQWSSTTISNNKLIDARRYSLILYGSTASSAMTGLSNNSFTGSIASIVNADAGSSISATCNWFGSLNAQTIASKISGSVTYSPWLSSGVDGSASTGFQPSGTCTGTAPTIASSVTNVTCFGLSNGAIDITASNGQAPYTYAWNGGSTAEDLTALAAGTYTVTVTDANGSTVSASITVSQPAAPAAAGAISGTASACLPGVTGSQAFTVPTSTNAASYVWAWTGTSGVTIGSNGSQSISLDYTATAVQGGITGVLTVTPTDICGNTGAASSVNVEYQVTYPVTPPTISGAGKVCPGDAGVTYSIASVARATSYTWSVPSGMTIVSGQGTNTISVSAQVSFAGGSVSVIASNICGNSPARSKSVVTNPPASPGAITASQVTGFCSGAYVTPPTASFSIAAVANASSYTWTMPSGLSISTGAGTTAITAAVGSVPASGATVSVVAVNNCGSSAARSVSVTGTPGRPEFDPLPGTSVCTLQVSNYAVKTVAGAASYNWTVSSSNTITAGNGTKNVTVQWRPTAATGQAIIVNASNSCGTSLNRSRAGITVAACARESAKTTQMLVYPNPTSDIVNIEFNSETAAQYRMQLVDMAGRVVFSQQGETQTGFNKFSLNVGEMAAGVYLLQTENGGMNEVTRLIIE